MQLWEYYAVSLRYCDVDGEMLWQWSDDKSRLSDKSRIEKFDDLGLQEFELVTVEALNSNGTTEAYTYVFKRHRS